MLYYLNLCRTCADLLAAYKHAVKLYTTSVSELQALGGDDFWVFYPKTTCRERHKAWMARDGLMVHWRQDHNGLAAKMVLRDDFQLASKQVEQLWQACRAADDALIAHCDRSAVASAQKQTLHRPYTELR